MKFKYICNIYKIEFIMEEHSLIKIDIQSETERFKEHLNIPGNNRILFSGMFGIGKTYFLDSFFNKCKRINKKLKIYISFKLNNFY